MPLPEAVEAVPMVRIAVVGPADDLRAMLAVVAEAGVTELESSTSVESSEMSEALRRLHAAGAAEDAPRLSDRSRTASELEAARRADLLAGEVELERRSAAAATRGPFFAALGWCPAPQLGRLRERLEPLGGGAVELPKPPFAEPPTLLRTPRAAAPFLPLVETYGTVRYRDIDPTPFTAVSFVLMFGMMFADAGHGLLLAAAGLFLRFTRVRRLAGLKRSWALPFAAGLVAAAFGLAYGEFFGPTGAVPVLWLRPLQNPLELLVVGVGIGGILLAVSYVIGSVNRWREGGFQAALYSGSGIAGTALFLGVAGVALAVYTDSVALAVVAFAFVVVAIALLFTGYFVQAGKGGTGVLEALVETVNSVIRLGANSISFARLAAFGMVHAAIGSLVWAGTQATAEAGWLFVAVVLFVAGNALGFALELVVAGIQAMRLEYYELFSRIYSGEGRPFRPWHLTVIKEGS